MPDMAPRTKTPPAHLTNMARGRVAPLADLTLLEGNPNQGDVHAVARSLRRFGQKTPIVLTPDGVVVKGNTTTAAARLLLAGGLDGDEPRPEWADVWVVDDPEEAAAEQIAYALADNRTGRLGEDDPELLLQMLGRVDDLDGLGYDDDDLADLRALGEEKLGQYGDNGSVDDAKSFDDQLDDYGAKAVRSLVFDLQIPVFAWFVEQAPKARTDLQVHTNADLLIALLAEHLGVDRPAVEPAVEPVAEQDTPE